MQTLLGLFFAAFALFAGLASFFQFATGHYDGAAERNAENSGEKREQTVRRARFCSVAAGICLVVAILIGAFLRMG